MKCKIGSTQSITLDPFNARRFRLWMSAPLSLDPAYKAP